jgi:hypothetical protein
VDELFAREASTYESPATERRIASPSSNRVLCASPTLAAWILSRLIGGIVLILRERSCQCRRCKVDGGGIPKSASALLSVPRFRSFTRSNDVIYLRRSDDRHYIAYLRTSASCISIVNRCGFTSACDGSQALETPIHSPRPEQFSAGKLPSPVQLPGSNNVGSCFSTTPDPQQRWLCRRVSEGIEPTKGDFDGTPQVRRFNLRNSNTFLIPLSLLFLSFFNMTKPVAIVTGAGSGIGEAVAQHLYSRGYKVVVADMNSMTGEKVASALGSDATFIQADVSSYHSQASLFKRAYEWGGNRLDFCHANAGIDDRQVLYDSGDKEELDDEGLLKPLNTKTMAVNLEGVIQGLWLFKYYVRRSKEAGGGKGKFVATSSAAGL